MLALLGSEEDAFSADPPRVKLVYFRGAGADKCPDERALRNGVAGRLGRDPFDDHAERTVTARILRLRKTLSTRIEVRDAAGELVGERELSSRAKDCAELAAATELALAIAIDPLGAMAPDHEGIDESTPAVAPPPPARAQDARPTEPASRPPAVGSPPAPVAPVEPRPHLQFHADGGAIVSAGAAPDAALGGRLLFGLRKGSASLGAEGRLDAPASKPVGPGSIRTSLLLASLVPCYHYRAFAGCAIFGAGALRAKGRSFTDSRDATTAVFVVGARGGVEIPLQGPLFFDLHADLLVPLSRTTVEVNQSDVWRSPRLSGVIGMGLAVTFP